MNCHNCGVSLSWDGKSSVVACDICHTFRCVGTPDDSADRIVLLGNSGKCHCPKCRRRLKQGAMDGLMIEHCTSCRGVLLEGNAFAMLLRNRRPEFRHAVGRHLFFNENDDPSKVRCPGCRRGMETHPYLGPNAIIVDSCLGCGMVWLDCQNVETVQQATVQHSVVRKTVAPMGIAQKPTSPNALRAEACFARR
jgi:Zn-finger nucleic acid-binding protein